MPIIDFYEKVFQFQAILKMHSVMSTKKYLDRYIKLTNSCVIYVRAISRVIILGVLAVQQFIDQVYLLRMELSMCASNLYLMRIFFLEHNSSQVQGLLSMLFCSIWISALVVNKCLNLSRNICSNNLTLFLCYLSFLSSMLRQS